MPFVCTGKLVADGKRYAHGEPVPSAATWAPHHRAMLIRSGAIAQVSDAEAKTMAEHMHKQQAADKLKNLTRAHAAASQKAQALESESRALEASLLKLKADLDAAAKEKARAYEELAAHGKAHPAVVSAVKAESMPRVAPVEHKEPEPPKPTADDERRVLMAQTFSVTRGDLIAKAKAEGIDLSKLAKSKKEDVQAAYVDAVMARKSKAKSA